MEKEIHSVAIVGMGALGLLFGGQIDRQLGRGTVQFIADAARARRYQDTTFTINDVPQPFTVCESTAAQPADLVIVAVKYTALEAALDTMAHCVGPDTTIISVLNGISSEEIIGRRYSMERILYTVAQGMDAVKFGSALHYSKFGTLNIGLTPGACPARLAALTAFLARAGVPTVVEADIRHRMWAKFMLNVGVNQCCMAFETNYGGALAAGPVRDTMLAAMQEVQLLAAAEGVTLTDAERTDYITLLAGLSPTGMPSMRQDGVAHRPSEVEMFAGTVCRMAKAHGLAVPVNTLLYDRIRRMEAAY